MFSAIGIPVAGVLGGWNQGAADGLWCTFVGTLLVGVLYICLMACYGELVATVPFSGGAFGYCRCALGPFWGFVVGASEVLQYFTFVASSVQFGSTAVTFALGASPDLEPIYYLIIYLVTFFVQLRGGNLLWNVVIVCSVVTIFPVILFLIGAFMKFDYNKYANAAPNMYESFPSGDGFMRSAFLGPSYFYIGIEMLPQVCNHVRDPNITLPRGMYYGCILSTVIALLAVIACAGTTPGYGVDLSAVSYPMDHILWEVYGISSDVKGVLFVLSSSLVCVFSLMYSSGHQMGSLAKSGLLPSFMTKTYGPHQVPYVCLIISTLLQFTFCCAVRFKFPEFSMYKLLYIPALFVYLGSFAAYIVFATRFKNMQRHWYSPLGITGAVVGIIIDVVMIASTFGYVLDANVYIGIYFVFIALSIVYYFAYAQHHQFFSPEEQQRFLKAYITNVNKRKKTNRTSLSVSGMVGDTMVVMFGRSNLFRSGSTHASTSRNNSNHASASAGAGATTTKSKLESFNKKVAPAPATTSTASATAGTDGTRPPAEVILVTSAPHGTAANVTRIAPLPSTEGTDGHEEADDEGDGNALTFVENDTVLAPPVDAGTPMSTRGSGSHAGGNSARKSALRTSWNVKQQNVFGMSNKSLSTKDSQKFMEIILCHGDQPPEKLLSTLATEWPDQFVVESPSEPV
jgi:ethanolamine permease